MQILLVLGVLVGSWVATHAPGHRVLGQVVIQAVHGAPIAVRGGPSVGPRATQLRVFLSLSFDRVRHLLVLKLVEKLHEEEGKLQLVLSLVK